MFHGEGPRLEYAIVLRTKGHDDRFQETKLKVVHSAEKGRVEDPH